VNSKFEPEPSCDNLCSNAVRHLLSKWNLKQLLFSSNATRPNLNKKKLTFVSVLQFLSGWSLFCYYLGNLVQVLVILLSSLLWSAWANLIFCTFNFRVNTKDIKMPEITTCWSPCFWHMNVRDGTFAVAFYTTVNLF